MGKTNISWTDYSWNPWIGCRKVSAGCKNCYMFREQKRFGQDPNDIRRTGDLVFNQPLRWKDPAKVFLCSWSDYLIQEADDWRDAAWDIVRRTPHLIYQILTKRPENIRSRLPDDWGEGWDNVWLGVSIESQEQVHRGWRFVDLPAKLRFLSIEPLIDKVDLHWLLAMEKISWVIVGGESGPNHRPMELDWVRYIKEDCEMNGVAFFMKQDSGPKPGMRGRIPDDLWIQEFPDIKQD